MSCERTSASPTRHGGHELLPDSIGSRGGLHLDRPEALGGDRGQVLADLAQQLQRSLRELHARKVIRHAIGVYDGEHAQKDGPVEVLPVREFFERLPKLLR